MICLVQNKISLGIRFAVTQEAEMEKFTAWADAKDYAMLLAIPGDQECVDHLARQLGHDGVEGDWFLPSPELIQHMLREAIGKTFYDCTKMVQREEASRWNSPSSN